MSFEVVESEPVPDIVRALLSGLPEWFGDPASLEEYVADARSLPTLLAVSDAGRPIGALLPRRHFLESVEIHVLAVSRDWHRHGVGRALVDALTAQVAGEARLMSVKTLGPSMPDENYALTRRFYEACGFLALEETDELWDDHPCLIMVKPLG